MMHIDPLKNGLHSLAEALRAFYTFHKDNTDIFALKDSILRSHHALETLFKYTLYKINPVFLLSKRTKIQRVVNAYEAVRKNEVSTILDNEWTINLEEALKRLRRFKELETLEDAEYQHFLSAVHELDNYRDSLQHLGLSADTDVIGRVLGNVLPRAVDVLNNKIPYEMQTLNQILPEADSVIDLLRTNYDSLIGDAISFFKGRSFPKQILKLTIKDHGKVGAPPYIPEIRANGFLQFEYDNLKLTLEQRLPLLTETASREIPYMAQVIIGQPTFTEESEYPNFKVAKGSLVFEGRVIFEKASGVLSLPNSNNEEKIAILRNMSVTINAVLNYKALALSTDWHYSCEKILEAEGSLNLEINTVSKGYKHATGSRRAEVIGQYTSNLNEINAPFRLHSFVAPDGTLKDNYLLEWNVTTESNLIFI